MNENRNLQRPDAFVMDLYSLNTTLLS